MELSAPSLNRALRRGEVAAVELPIPPIDMVFARSVLVPLSERVKVLLVEVVTGAQESVSVPVELVLFSVML
jgi:hypothetical protein